jgi:hypothetical protein
LPNKSRLVGVKNITALSAQPTVLNLKPDPKRPSCRNTRSRERRIAAHCNDILWSITLGVEIRCVNETSHRHHVDDRERNSFLLRRLAQCTRHPAEDDGVDRIHARREEEAGNVSCGDIERCGADDESDNGKTHHGGDVPRSVIELSGGDTNQDADGAGDKGGWRGKDESNGSVEAKGFDYGREELGKISECVSLHRKLVNVPG